MDERQKRAIALIAVYFITIKNLTMNLMSNIISFSMEQQRRLQQIISHQVLDSTPLLNAFPSLLSTLQLNNWQRTVWMKERSTDWWERIVQNHFRDDDWLETFRMTKTTFLWLCGKLQEKLAPNENQIGTREAVSVEKQVAICLYYLASCCEYRVVANAFGVHKSTVWKCIHKVIDAINTHLKDSWLCMPDQNECREIAAAFERKTHLPQIIGAIDATHIPILPPTDGYRDYINRKKWASILLQAVVDDKYRFRNINCGVPGSCHDAAVFETSKLSKYSNILIPQENRTILNTAVPYLIIGDPAYPLLEWLMKGYIKNEHLTAEEESLNVYLNSARVCVEIAFGRLKARWRRILKRIDAHYDYAPHITFACCILHNIVETRNEVFLPQWEHTARVILAQQEQPERRRSRRRDNFTANNTRETLKEYMAQNFPLRRTFIA